MLLNYHIGHFVLVSLCVGENDQCGNSTTQSQAPDDGYSNAPKHVEHIRSKIK